MASVSSLDQDMRKLRLDRYTPAAASEIRGWIEHTLGEPLPAGDLMDALKDGVALCKLVNLVISPSIKYKTSAMPFVQMENISHFLKACEMSPLSLPSHDRFLTVDLYESKDPAQVLQCIAAFSRRANAINPNNFPVPLGATGKGGAMSPQGTGRSATTSPSYTVNTPPPKAEPVTTFNPLNKSAYSSNGRASPTKASSLARGGLATGGPVSSWSKPSDENNTAPAWNIHQYGYMGGASQGNQGIAFGARRQITSTGPSVPSLEEKQRRLREIEEQQRQMDAEEEARVRRAAELDESRAKEEEERSWAEATERARQAEAEHLQSEQERRQRSKLEAHAEAQAKARAEQESEARLAAERSRNQQINDSTLNGQFLSQYKAQQGAVAIQPLTATAATSMATQESAEQQRIAELERQLAEMKEAEKKREMLQSEDPAPKMAEVVHNPVKSSPGIRSAALHSQTSHEDDWEASEREYLSKQHQLYQQIAAEEHHTPIRSSELNSTPRPLPVPASETTNYRPDSNRTDRFLSSNPAPEVPVVASHRPADYSTTSELDLENTRRIESQQKTKAGGWASKSLLEREMELERQRQAEWQADQEKTASRQRDDHEGAGPGQSWDVHQYGYMGGDSQNRGGPGLGVGGARRQIIGPRPPP